MTLQIIRDFKNALGNKAQDYQEFRAVITASDGSRTTGDIWRNENRRLVWFQQWGSGNIGWALCDAIEPVIGLGVIIKFNPDIGVFEILRDDPFLRNADSSPNRRSFRALTEADFQRGGRFQLFTEGEMFQPLAVVPAAAGGLAVDVGPGWYFNRSTATEFLGQASFDISGSQPAGPNEHRFVGIYIDTSDTIQSVDGTAVATASTAPEPSWPSDTLIRLAVVDLDDSQTSIDFEADIDNRRAFASTPSGAPDNPVWLINGTTITGYDDLATAFADAVAGDTIFKYHGIETGTIAVDKAVTIVGTDPERTGITASSGLPFNVTGDADFRGLSALSTATSGSASAFYVDGATCNISDMVIRATGADTTHAGITLTGGASLFAVDCKVEASGATTNNYALNITNSSTMIFEGGEIIGDIEIASGSLELRGTRVNGSITHTGTFTGWYIDVSTGAVLIAPDSTFPSGWPMDHVILVADNDYADYSGIQTAINAASAGDTILIDSGPVWAESFSVNKAVRVVGLGPEGARIEVSSGVVVAVTSDGASLENVKVVNLAAAGTVATAVQVNGDCTLRNVRAETTAGGASTGYAFQIGNSDATAIVDMFDCEGLATTHSNARGIVVEGGTVNLHRGIFEGDDADFRASGGACNMFGPVFVNKSFSLGGGTNKGHWHDANGSLNSIPSSGFPFTIGADGGVGDVTLNAGSDITLQGASGGPQSGTARDLLAGVGHILDGGDPDNPYPATRDADDAEFNNAVQAENNTIGTHAGGDFWEWSPGAATTVSINGTVENALYVLKNAADSATDRYLAGNISTIGTDDVYMAEICLLPFYNGWKVGYYIALKLIDTTSGKYIRIKRNDDAANGTQFIGSYDTGGGETTVFNHTTGHLAPMVTISIERYISGTDALGRFYYKFKRASSGVGFAAVAGQNMGAKANFVPDEVRIEFSNQAGGAGQSWTIDSYRRVT